MVLGWEYSGISPPMVKKKKKKKLVKCNIHAATDMKTGVVTDSKNGSSSMREGRTLGGGGGDCITRINLTIGSCGIAPIMGHSFLA